MSRNINAFSNTGNRVVININNNRARIDNVNITLITLAEKQIKDEHNFANVRLQYQEGTKLSAKE